MESDFNKIDETNCEDFPTILEFIWTLSTL